MGSLLILLGSQVFTIKRLSVVVPAARDPVARKIRLRRMKDAEDEESAGQVMKGMKDLAKARRGSRDEVEERQPLKYEQVLVLHA